MSKKHLKILREVLKDITPSTEEKRKLEKLAKKALRLVVKEAKKYNATAILAGSITRNTWLPDKLEFDIFILFPERMSEGRMETLGLRIGKKVIRMLNGSFEIEYAEHPYVSGKVNEVDIDIVPCYALESLEKIKSAVDRTPFHVRYLEKKFRKKMAKEVRLLKQFLKANDIYGADAKVQGFSGYVCELLLIKYQTFMNLLRKSVKWEPREIIDIENYYSKKEYPKLRAKFKNQPLILIDPVDKNRNATAALSVKNFFKFKKLAKDFLQKPSIDLFYKEDVEALSEEEFIKNLRNREMEIIIIKFQRPKVVDDVLWPQLRKFSERLESILREYGFKVFAKGVFANDNFCYVLLELEVWRLPILEKRIGPIVFDLRGSEEFIKKYRKRCISGPYIEKNRWIVEIKRMFPSAVKKLEDSLSESAEILKAKGIPSHIANQIAKEFSIFSGSEVVILLRNLEFARFLRRYFEKEKLI
jgi:tRNA nucleotidyltransferase (CCA-adding enzyme)